ncbi:MAG: rhamnulokinase [Meiothermus sp.]
MSVSRHVAVDLGASGGRVALGTVQEGRLEVEVLHRFSNGPVQVPVGDGINLYWDVLGLWREILHGLRQAAAKGPTASVGVDSWGVDFALLDEHGLVLEGLRHYRDPRTEKTFRSALTTLDKERIYEHTGLQFMPINTLYQLLAVQQQRPDLLAQARHFLMVPDLFHFWLSGKAVCERTNASTTQLFDPRKGDWSGDVLEAFNLPKRIFSPIVEPGTVLGPLRPALAKELGLENTVVIAPGTHDTASAVAAVPAEGENWAYISSGTWSLVGIETAHPVISEAALGANLTNEAGIHSTTRLLKNVMGLWILQECRHAWGDVGFPVIYAEAEAAPAFTAFIDPDDIHFLAAGLDMPSRIQTYCRQKGQKVPETQGQITRCVLESLALKYRVVLDTIEQVSAQKINVVHVVGGGSLVEVLCQWTADATGRVVLAGPVDATLMGNLLVQAEGFASIAKGEARALVRSMVQPKLYQPQNQQAWEGALHRFRGLL